ncbi:MAG: hypothetical protein Q9219_000659 [cf. Caloplaca sp. 3 TL-2023]
MVYRGNQKPTIQITLTDGQQDAFLPSYTSLDQIRGNVKVTTFVDTTIDLVYMTFEGVTKTYVEKVATTAPTNCRQEAFQTNLRLVQPMTPADYPPSNLLKAGQTYTFPFIFVVPETLLPQICDHSTEHDQVQQAHMQLPPTLGDPLTAVWGRSLMDDMAPDMAVVSYAVRARITTGRGADGKHNVVAEDSKKVRVVPAVLEQAPLIVHGGKEDDYSLRKEKVIKKGTFMGTLGSLVMETAQPRALRLPQPRAVDPCPVTTMATINLRFDPTSPDAQPPRLNCLTTKLKVATFYSSKPQHTIPKRSSDYHVSADRGLYIETLNLSSRNVSTVQWERHAGASPPRRDSALSSVSVSSPTTPEPSAAYSDGRSYYTTHILVPITLPRKNDGSGSSKIFVPTFHSCLLSRIYLLDFDLSCQTPGTSFIDPSMRLKVPIQICAEGNPDARPSISPEEAQAIARREAAEFGWQPRSVAPPSPDYIQETQPPAFAPPSPDYVETPPLSERSSRSSVHFQTAIGNAEQSGSGVRTIEDPAPPDYSVYTTGRPNVSHSATRSSPSP